MVKYLKIIDPISFKKYNIKSEEGIEILNFFLMKGGLNKNYKNYFLKNNNLNLKKQKFCRCILHVAEKNSSECNKKKKWNTSKCYNPYTVCANSTKTTTGGKSCNYNFLSKDISNNKIKSYKDLNYKSYSKWLKKNKKKHSRKNLNNWYISK